MSTQSVKQYWAFLCSQKVQNGVLCIVLLFKSFLDLRQRIYHDGNSVGKHKTKTPCAMRDMNDLSRRNPMVWSQLSLASESLSPQLRKPSGTTTYPNLEGSIPKAWQLLTDLVYLQFGDNTLSRTFPSEMCVS
jgi:hypothetical protein